MKRELRRSLGVWAFLAECVLVLGLIAPPLFSGEPYFIKVLHPGPLDQPPPPSVPFGERLLFVAVDAEHGAELWVTDGTETGTRLLKDIEPGPDSSAPRDITIVGGKAAFLAGEVGRTQRLCVTDGTEAGTEVIQEIPLLGDQARAERLTAAGARVFFVAGGDSGAWELWASDLTPGGTRRVFAGQSEWTAIGLPQILVPVGQRLFVLGAHGATADPRWALVVSDGTEEGTTLIERPAPEGCWPQPREAARVGDLVFVCAWSDTALARLWVTDGTEEGTRLLGASAEGGEPVDPFFLTPADGRLFFCALGKGVEHELWVSDGTEEGTRLVKDIRPGPLPSYPGNFTPWRDGVIFTADDGAHGNELWISDGTEEGTRLLKDIYPGSYSSVPLSFTRAADRVFFIAEDDVHGLETWVTDGTEGGTRLVKELNPGREKPYLEFFGSLGRWVLIVLNRGEGRDSRCWLLLSDGTEAGTKQLAYLWRDDVPLYPGQVVRVGDRAFFSSSAEGDAYQLWAVDLSQSRLDFASFDAELGSIDVLLSAKLPVADFSFELRLDAACAGAWIREVLPGPDLPGVPERWEAAVAPDGQSAAVSCSLGREDSGPFLEPGSGLRIARVLLCGGGNAREACSLCFADRVGEPAPETACASIEDALPVCFRRGDANGDGARNISDPIFVLYWLFGNNVVRCIDAADSNDDGRVNVSDPVYELRFLFSGGPPPPPPGPSDCGPDGTADDLGCEAYAACR